MELTRERRLTRRQLLVAAGAASAAAVLSSSQSRVWRGGGDIELTAAAAVPGFVSRPDLRIPALAVTTPAGAGIAPGLILLAPYDAPRPAQAGALIVDNGGSAVWEQPLANVVTTDFRVQSYRGRPALTWWEGRITLGHGVGRYVIADSNYKPIAYVEAGDGRRGDLHEFLVTDRGTALLTSYAIVDADLRSVGGPRRGTIQNAMFQEVELGSGRVLFEWQSLDHIPIAESYWPVGSGADWDYVHLNSIAVDSDHNLLVSSRNTHTIYKIDRRSGEVIWRLGGKHSDFAIASDATFAWQHDARRQPDGTISIFDNGYGGASRALLLSVDEAGRRVSRRRSFTRPAPTFANSQGNVQMLPSGNVFVGWGAQPYVSEFAPSGELIFDAQLGSRYISYRAYRAAWVSLGAGAPAVAAQRSAGRTSVYVSWNGDTRVSQWTVLAGEGSSTGLRALRPVARRGFETVIEVPAAVTHVRVRGSDAAGRTLATSALVRV
ncbi:MAG TPA: arylsulfotransferase family protein [Solirubrobacteraceae bacterium]|nr:arylsulfotransferase family protein [Solirubrobacteraceae bacterium]